MLLDTPAALLLALRPGPACGLALIERVVRRTGRRGRPAQGSVYPALKELERKGLVRRLAPPEARRRGRARVEYELTLAGVRASDRTRQAVLSLVTAGQEVAAPVRARMEERVHEGIALSQFAARLQRGLERSPRRLR